MGFYGTTKVQTSTPHYYRSIYRSKHVDIAPDGGLLMPHLDEPMQVHGAQAAKGARAAEGFNERGWMQLLLNPIPYTLFPIPVHGAQAAMPLKASMKEAECHSL
jgi:hypothetical protein